MVRNPEQSWQLSQEGADIPALIGVWDEAIKALASAAALCDDTAGAASAWLAQTPCPGWTVADIVAHTVGLEIDLHGEAPPDHEPDWTALPHVVGDVGQYIEVSVDDRRGRSKAELLTELDSVIELREQDLAQSPTDPGDMTPGVAGFPMRRDRMLQTRILDLWIHEQDIRIAADLPGGLDCAAAWVTAGRLAAGLPRMWGKVLGATGGQTFRIEVTGPSVEFTQTIGITDEGRAAVISNGQWDMPIDGPPAAGNLLLRCSFPAYVELAAGRDGTDKYLANGELEISGDPALAARLIPAMAVTP